MSLSEISLHTPTKEKVNPWTKNKAVCQDLYSSCGENFIRLPEELQKSTIYLVDWKHAIEHDATITNFRWHTSFPLCLPTSYRLEHLLKDIPRLKPVKKDVLTEEEKNTITFVAKFVNEVRVNDFQRIIRSLYPLIACECFQSLDPMSYVNRYRRIRTKLALK